MQTPEITPTVCQFVFVCLFDPSITNPLCDVQHKIIGVLVKCGMAFEFSLTRCTIYFCIYK